MFAHMCRCIEKYEPVAFKEISMISLSLTDVGACMGNVHVYSATLSALSVRRCNAGCVGCEWLNIAEGHRGGVACEAVVNNLATEAQSNVTCSPEASLQVKEKTAIEGQLC